MRRALDFIYTASAAFAAACLAAICVVMLVQAFGREVGLLVRGAIHVRDGVPVLRGTFE